MNFLNKFKFVLCIEIVLRESYGTLKIEANDKQQTIKFMAFQKIL